MIEATGIDHIVLRTTRLTEMLEFYVQVLGCQIERETEKALGLTQLRAGNALIDLVDVESNLGRKGGGAPTHQGNNMDHFCLQIKPLEEVEICRCLEAGGIEVGEFTVRYGAGGFGRSLYINDPEGNTVEIRCAG
ncbi:lactoylglutathione lyase [Photobacterium aquae]|uniref:Lactoylglutathione lyase n=1 Tax=Photobacterium aquae TaxID=1195763 RepID=A0A0J1H0Q6_9GAMM|nr:lactoylglutathione lyase [Photobacterium aquae]